METPQRKNVIVKPDPQISTITDWLTLTLAALGAIKLILAAPPFEINILPETMDAWANLVAILFAGYGIWANTYTSRKAQQQKDVLQQVGLKSKEKG